VNAVTTVTDRFMDLQEVAAYTRLSVRTLRRHLTGSTGSPLRSYHVGGKVLLRKSELDAWIESHERRPSASVANTLRVLEEAQAKREQAS
jgi:excisionase family DNA binding protein